MCIRKNLFENVDRNVIHGSDSPESGKREVGKEHFVVLKRLNLCYILVNITIICGFW